MPASADITQLLVAWSDGDQSALDRLMPLVYAELRRLARHQMRRERSDHSLQTTELVNEAYLRLIDVRQVQWENRAHFFSLSARLLRQILVDFARRRGARKRGGGKRPIALDEALAQGPKLDRNLAALDEAVTALCEVDPRAGRVVELRFFGGLSIEETAQAIRVSPETVRRDWRFARSWLRGYLTDEDHDGQGPDDG